MMRFCVFVNAKNMFSQDFIVRRFITDNKIEVISQRDVDFAIRPEERPVKVEWGRNRDLQVAVFSWMFDADGERGVTCRQFKNPRCSASPPFEQCWVVTH